jgi:ATP-dependent helicase/DNAse subunit B
VANQLQSAAWKERLAEAGGALGVNVLTFGQLYRALLRATGEASTLLDDALQHGLLRSTVHGLHLEHYASLIDKPGFAVLLHGMIAELKAARIGPQSFAVAVAKLGDEPRLRELVWIYAAYQEQLRANRWADEEELGWLALRALEDDPQLASDWSLLVVDGFDNLTTVQLDFLRLATPRARETFITLSGAVDGPERGLVQRRFLATRRALEGALGVRAEALPDGGTESRRTGSGGERREEALAHLERSFFVSQAAAYVPSEPGEGQAVTLIAAADRAGEVRAALRWLKARLVREGCRPGEVALLARKAEPYRALIQQTAEEFGIPIHLLDGLPLATNPAVAALLDLLGLFLPLSEQDPQAALPRRLVVEAWRSPYPDLDRAVFGKEAATQDRAQLDEGGSGVPACDAPALGADAYAAWADRLDGAARWGRVVGGLAQWREALARLLGRTAEEREDDDERGPGDLPRAEEIPTLQDLFERFVKRMEPPPTVDSVGDYVEWLEELIGPDKGEDEEDRGSLRVVARAAEGDGQAAERDVAALRALKDVLRGLVWAEQALGTPTPADYASFYIQLREAIEAATYGPPRDRDAGEVLVADVVQARGAPFRAVAVLGLAEGEFPVTLQEDPLLRDSDRLRLRGRGLPLHPSTESAEAGYFYETITRARSQLLLTRPRLAENGAIWEPSPYWNEVGRLVRVQPRVLGSESRIAPDEAASWPELLEGLAQCPLASPWHARASGTDGGRYRAWQASSAVFRERYAFLQSGARDPAGRQTEGRHNGDLSERAAELGERFGPQHVWSASRLESYRTCPQFFFVGAALGLQPREEPVEGLDARQLGNIYHRLFQEVYQACPKDARGDPGRLLATLGQVGERILDEAPRREGFRETAWWLQTRAEILDDVVRSLRELAALTGEYVPADFELEFDAVPIWATPDGQDGLLLHGFVDRVDRCADGGWRIIDYKTAGPSRYSRKALEDGKKLQLPLYALAIMQVLGGEIRDGFYWHVRQAQASALRLEDYGVDQSMEDALRFACEAVQGIRRGAFEPHPPVEGCPAYCPAASFCWSYRPGYGG